MSTVLLGFVAGLLNGILIGNFLWPRRTHVPGSLDNPGQDVARQDTYRPKEQR